MPKNSFAVHPVRQTVQRMVLLAVMLISGGVFAAESPKPASIDGVPGVVPIANDFYADASAARAAKQPVVVFVTASYCHYCEQLRDAVFQFLPDDPRFILREVVSDSDLALTGFDGKAVNHQQFASQLGVSLTPTVVLLDSQGQSITDPLVGVLTLDYYSFYFEKALAAAQQVLDAR